MLQTYTTQIDDVTVLTLVGRLDAYAAPEVRSQIIAALVQRVPRAVVDLSGVTIIDSSGLGALVAAMKRAREAGGDVALAGMQQSVRIIFELTRLDCSFAIAPDVPSAIELMDQSELPSE